MDKKTLDKLGDLAQLDTDAVGVYGEALERVEDASIKETLTDFRDEHDHHAKVLVAAIERLGGAAPALSVDLVGRLAEFVTQFRSHGGTRGALHALKSAEQYHNRRYAEAANWEIDDEELTMSIQQFYREEQRHLSYVESQLDVLASARQ